MPALTPEMLDGGRTEESRSRSTGDWAAEGRSGS